MALDDGLSLYGLFESYLDMTNNLGKKYPEVQATAMNCLLANPSFRSTIKSLIGMVRYCFVPKAKNDRLNQSIDVLFFNSSNKPSFGPATNTLAKKIKARGYQCMVMSYKSSILLESGREDSVCSMDNFHRPKNIKIGLTSLFQGFFIAIRILLTLIKSKKNFTHFLVRFIPSWLELAVSNTRYAEAKKFLSENGVKIFITHNEKIPIAAEIGMAARELNIHTVYFLSEHPDKLTEPVDSDEIWVWNETIAELMREICEASVRETKQNIHVIGHPESDYVETLKNLEKKNQNLPAKYLTAENIFVFISEYVDNPTWKRGPITFECVRWLEEAARTLPDWLFIFKTRPYHHLKAVPGFDKGTERLPPNLSIYRGDMTLPEFFASGRVSAAGALGSLGLFSAAMSGIPSFRFVVSEPNIPMTFLEEYAIKVSDARDLSRELMNLSQHREELRAKTVKSCYRGGSITRMEKFTLERLKFKTS